MKTVTIRTRLIGVIGFLSLLLLGIGAFGIYGMAKLDRSLETVYEDRVVPLKQLSDINSMMMENIRHLQLAGMHDPRLPEHTLHDHPLAVHHDKVAANIAEITKLWGDYMATFLTPDEKKLAEEFIARRTTFVQQGLLPAIELQKGGQFAEANMHLVRIAGPLYNEAYRLNQALLKLQQQVAEAEHHDAGSLYQRFRWIALLATLGGIALAALVGWALNRAITLPMRAAVAAANAVADGDLRVRVDAARDDEIGQMMQALSRMVERLRDVMARMQAASRTVSGESAELHEEVSRLSQRTEQQAANLEETAATMEELTCDGPPECAERQAGERHGDGGLDRRSARRPRRRRGGRHDGRDQRELEADRRHHRRHRRHRVPDQHPGAQRRGGSRARRRAGPRLRRGGDRGAQPGAAQRGGGEGDQGSDRRLGRQGERGHSWSIRPAARWTRSSSRSSG